MNFFFPRLARAARQLPRFPHAASLVWSAARGWTIAWAALLVAQGLLPVAVVYLTRPLVNSVLAAIRPGGDTRSALIATALTQAGLMAGVLLATEALRSLGVWVRTAQAELVRNYISGLVQEKSAAVDLGFYETPEFFDHLHRARAEAATVPLALIENLGGLLQNGITLVAMAGVLTTFGVWMPLALLAGTVPALYVVLRYAVRQHEWWVRTTPDDRRANYYDWVLTSREYAPELRLFALGPYFRSCFGEVRGRLAGERIALASGQSVAEFGAAAAALGVGGASLLWMGARAVRGQASAGDLALFYGAFQQGLGLMRALLGNAGQIYRSSLFLEGLFQFLDLKLSITDPAKKADGSDAGRLPQVREYPRGIRFRDVAFRYPGSAGLALQGLSLEAPAGRITAIVGENGAGKSTLVKLLCRFYDPESGSVEIDGHDLRELPVDELRRQITVLFQEPAHYHATVAANIAPGNGTPLGAIEEAARDAGADAIAAKLPLGYGHALGRWFEDGAELSVGEWQRIALARAFLRRAPVLILDEPTSAMDPWAEADWLERFRKLAAGRTTILITHRFTTARIADRIVVMARGCVIEQGTHSELLAGGGRYAAGWAAQGER